jgi:hypothetical protein
MAEDMAAVGVRLPRTVRAQLEREAKLHGRTLGGEIRLAVDEHLRGPVEIWGVSEAAEHLGVATGNFGRVKGLPAPLCRVRSGSLYDAGEIRALAERRRRARVDAA